jgi:outer membrane protein assembly factor BamE (lipoprotein component of BamABCDE complex)
VPVSLAPASRRRRTGIGLAAASPWIAPALSFAMVAIVSGCIAVLIPLGEGYVDQGREVDADRAVSIQLGVTTRDEVLAQLGEPAVIWEDGRIFAYSWHRVTWKVIIVVMYLGVGTKTVGTNHMLLVEFDEGWRVRRAERVERPERVTDGDFLKAWAKRDDDGSR